MFGTLLSVAYASIDKHAACDNYDLNESTKTHALTMATSMSPILSKCASMSRGSDSLKFSGMPK